MLLTKSRSISNENIFEQLKSGQKKLISHTTPIAPYDPVEFYHQILPNKEEKRFFWKSADEDFYLAGIGTTLQISGTSENRFNEIQQFWNELVSMIDISETDVRGTGPLLFGGFSFDPNSMKEQEWNDFGDSLFYLPKYMLTVINGKYFLTYNEITEQKDEDNSSLNNHLEDIINHLYTKKKIIPGKKVQIKTQHEIGQAEWIESVAEVVDILKTSHSIKKVVLARKMEIEFDNRLSIPYLIEQLRTGQPGSFTFALEKKGNCFLGASPERLVKKTGNQILSTCLAGSAPRSKDPKEDEKLGKDLLNDAKNRYEHQLVVKMIRDAFQPICTEMDVPDEPILMKTPAIQHLYTPVVGQVKPDQSIFKMVEQLHPTPALGGVPTKDALNIIREKEKMDRGFYASPIGWTDYRGNGEFVVGIRSGLIQDKKAILYAGCGLVPDSNPKDELIETRIKFRPMLHALGGEK